MWISTGFIRINGNSRAGDYDNRLPWGIPERNRFLMRSYLLRYLIFWLPAALMSYVFNFEGETVHVIQWFCVFFMLFGWGVNTGMAAYHYPRSTLSALLTYTGFNIIVIAVMYVSAEGEGLYLVTRSIGGIFSFGPLDALVQALKNFSGLMWEMCATGTLIAVCVIGYVVGLVQRRVSPNPYRPRIAKRKRNF